MYRSDFAILLTLLLNTASLSSAVGVGNDLALQACQGFAGGTLKCLTDVSYVICPGPNGLAIEQFVAAGTRCVKGEFGKQKDFIEAGVATVTATFAQVDPQGNPIGSNVVVPFSKRTA